MKELDGRSQNRIEIVLLLWGYLSLEIQTVLCSSLFTLCSLVLFVQGSHAREMLVNADANYAM